MIRLLHLIAISLLIGSAAYAYSTKYETLYYAETLAKLKTKLQKERETVAIAKAEWAMLTRPDRLQRIVDKHLDLQPMAISQLARLSDIPNRPSKDMIAHLIGSGMEPEATGSTSPAKPAAKPAAPKPAGLGAKIDSLLGGGAKPISAKPAQPKRTLQLAPPPAKPVPKPEAKAAPKPAAPAATPPKPAAR